MNSKNKPAIPGIRAAVIGLTPYRPGTFIEEVQDQFGLDQVIKIASNENPYGPYPHSIERMRQEVERLNQYPDSNFKALRHTIGRVHGISADCICLSHGAEGMLQTIGKCFLENGDEVIVPGVTYTLYSEISKVMGARVISAPMTAEHVDLAAIGQQVGRKTKLIWLANPNNPTGTLFDPHEFTSFLAQLPKHVWVILDEAYAEFADAAMLPDRVSLVRSGHSIISVRTFSKAYGLAGARLGYAIADPQVITIINTVSEPFNANRVAIAGALAAMDEDGVHFKRAIMRIQKDRALTWDRLRRMGLRVIPSHANFIMFETPLPAMSVYDALIQSGIIVRPCNAWGYDHMLRVSIGATEQMNAFAETLSVILKDAESADWK